MHELDLIVTLAGSLGAALVCRLGATPEQIDRERARVHEELSGSST